MANRKNVHVVQRGDQWGTLREGGQRGGQCEASGGEQRGEGLVHAGCLLMRRSRGAVRAQFGALNFRAVGVSPG